MLNSIKHIKLFSPGFRLGNKSAILFTFFLQFYNILLTQENLVPNGSFEEYTNCPLGIADFSVTEWISPTWGTSDYFNACNIVEVGAPDNFIGSQNPRSGLGYSGFASSFDLDNPNIREYIQVELKSKLETNMDYVFSCFVSLAESSKYCTNEVDVAFSNNPINGNYSTTIIHPNFLECKKDDFLCDTINWIELNIVFTANGGEKFITIGLFKDDINSNIQISNTSTSNSYAYYYVDDVSLIKYQLPKLPNVFTPNEDGINDLWKIDLLNGFEVSIYNRWGELIDSNRVENHFYSWDGKTKDGLECAEGIYYYMIRKNNIKETGFIQLMR